MNWVVQLLPTPPLLLLLLLDDDPLLELLLNPLLDPLLDPLLELLLELLLEPPLDPPDEPPPQAASSDNNTSTEPIRFDMTISPNIDFAANIPRLILQQEPGICLCQVLATSLSESA